MANILVVDDEMGIRELLSEILGDEGHMVELAENAQQAREARLRQVPDLVLLDIWMPDTDGVSLLKEWSSQGLLTMPVIMMSGHATIDTAVEASRIGALNFLEKPIALQKLLKAVEQGLEKNASQRQREVYTQAAAVTQEIGDTTPPSAGVFGQENEVIKAITAPAFEPPVPVQQFSFDMPLRDARDVFERAYFEYHLQREGGSMTRVAEKTGLERTHLYRKLKQLGVDLSRGRHESN